MRTIKINSLLMLIMGPSIMGMQGPYQEQLKRERLIEYLKKRIATHTKPNFNLPFDQVLQDLIAKDDATVFSYCVHFLQPDELKSLQSKVEKDSAIASLITHILTRD